MLDIYGPVVLNTAISSEVETPTEEAFRRRIAATLQRLPWLVCLCQNRVAGYAYAAPFRNREGYRWSVEVSVYVSEEFRGRGGGGVVPLHFAARGTAHPWLLQCLRWDFPSQPRHREPSRARGLQACGCLPLRGVQAGPVARRWLLAVDVAGARRRAVSPKPLEYLASSSQWAQCLEAAAAGIDATDL